MDRVYFFAGAICVLLVSLVGMMIYVSVYGIAPWAVGYMLGFIPAAISVCILLSGASIMPKPPLPSDDI